MHYPEIFGRGNDAAISATGRFDTIAYTGVALNLGNWELPVIVDLNGLKIGKSLVANLDHDSTKRVGVISEVDNDGRRLRLAGALNAATESRREVVESSRSGFIWQASIEVSPEKVESIKNRVTVNGRSFEGPVYVTRVGTLKGFAFVSHGADDDTVVRIAASRSPYDDEPFSTSSYSPPPSRVLTTNGYTEVHTIERR